MYKATEEQINQVNDVLESCKADTSWMTPINYLNVWLGFENAALDFYGLNEGDFETIEQAELAYVESAFAEEYHHGAGCYERACNDFAMSSNQYEEHLTDAGY